MFEKICLCTIQTVLKKSAFQMTGLGVVGVVGGVFESVSSKVVAIYIYICVYCVVSECVVLLQEGCQMGIRLLFAVNANHLHFHLLGRS
jgi:hypothetical protein